MRQIKFRGKNESWIYGGVSIFNGEATIFDENSVDNSAYEVEFNSVGQFTGLNDKNGVEIYEGDILRLKCMGWECAVVKFNYGVFGFYVTEDSHLVSHVPQYWENCEIIGNIHDNPELACMS